MRILLRVWYKNPAKHHPSLSRLIIITFSQWIARTRILKFTPMIFQISTNFSISCRKYIHNFCFLHHLERDLDSCSIFRLSNISYRCLVYITWRFRVSVCKSYGTWCPSVSQQYLLSSPLRRVLVERSTRVSPAETKKKHTHTHDC